MMPASPPSIGRIDATGKLTDAEARLAELNRRAGGEIGEPIAVPQLAATVRLSQRLGIAIARTIIAADGDDDLELWVSAEPEGEGVRIEVSGWKAREPWSGSATELTSDPDYFRASADWIWETDAALRLVHLSARGTTPHGFEREPMLGMPLTRLFALAEDNGEFPILSALASQARFDGQAAMVRDSGAKVRLAATPRLDPAGRFAGFSGAAYLVDPELGERTDAVQDASGPLTSGMVRHLDRALRDPLSRIIANADSISARSDGPLRSDYAEYATDISVAGRHLLSLVQDLADLQSIEAADFVVAAEDIDLADLARRAAGLLSVRASQAEVTIDRPDAGDQQPVTGDFKRTLQILVNLIGNAVRYSPRGGMVWLRIERDGDTAYLIVADQGKGIAVEDQARIFEKFERVDPGEAGGSGLGLYIARRLARAMGGDIGLDSAPGQGARFILTLPARD